MRRKVPVSLIHVGDKVTINVSPSKRLPNLGYFRTATLPDGTVLRDCGFAAFREGIAKGKTGLLVECMGFSFGYVAYRVITVGALARR